MEITFLSVTTTEDIPLCPKSWKIHVLLRSILSLHITKKQLQWVNQRFNSCHIRSPEVIFRLLWQLRDVIRELAASLPSLDMIFIILLSGQSFHFWVLNLCSRKEKGTKIIVLLTIPEANSTDNLLPVSTSLYFSGKLHV